MHSIARCRMTILFLCLNGLDLISDISEVIPDETRKSYIEWIYSQQIVPNSSDGRCLLLSTQTIVI